MRSLRTARTTSAFIVTWTIRLRMLLNSISSSGEKVKVSTRMSKIVTRRMQSPTKGSHSVVHSRRKHQKFPARKSTRGAGRTATITRVTTNQDCYSEKWALHRRTLVMLLGSLMVMRLNTSASTCLQPNTFPRLTISPQQIRKVRARRRVCPCRYFASKVVATQKII